MVGGGGGGGEQLRTMSATQLLFCMDGFPYHRMYIDIYIFLSFEITENSVILPMIIKHFPTILKELQHQTKYRSK